MKIYVNAHVFDPKSIMVSYGDEDGCSPRRPNAEVQLSECKYGEEFLTEVFKKHVNPKSGVVSDMWTSTPPAVKNAGSEMMGVVNHGDYWKGLLANIK